MYKLLMYYHAWWYSDGIGTELGNEQFHLMHTFSKVPATNGWVFSVYLFGSIAVTIIFFVDIIIICLSWILFIYIIYVDGMFHSKFPFTGQ